MNEQKSRTPLDLPILPQFPTTTDSTISTSFKCETRPVILPSNIPSLGASKERQIHCISQIDLSTWQKIYNNCNLFKGLRFDDKNPRHSFYSVCQFKKNITQPHCNTHDASFVEAYLANNERHNTFIRNKLIKIDASFQCPFISLKFEKSKSDQSTQIEETKTLYTTCAWNFPRVELFLFDEDGEENQQCLESTLEFQRAVEQIFLLPDEEQYSNLCKVFSRYGQVYPKTVVLGGQLFYTHIQSVRADVNENEHKNSVVSGFKASLATKLEIGGGIGGGRNKSERKTNQTIKQQSAITYETIGGNTLFGQNPGEWCLTVEDNQRWRVIEYGELIPVYKLLNNELKKKIDEIIKREEILLRRPVFISKRSLKIWKVDTILEKYQDALINHFNIKHIRPPNEFAIDLSTFAPLPISFHLYAPRLTVDELQQHINTIEPAHFRIKLNEYIPLLTQIPRKKQTKQDYQLQYEENGAVSIEIPFTHMIHKYTRYGEEELVQVGYGKYICRRENNRYDLNFVYGYFDIASEENSTFFSYEVDWIPFYPPMNRRLVTPFKKQHILIKTISLFNSVHEGLKSSWPNRIDLVEIDENLNWDQFSKLDYDKIFKKYN